jgi:hypothetical protein
LFLSICCCVFASSGASAFSSQLVPIHSPLISSIVDLVCSFYQTHYNPSFFTVWSPLRSELCTKVFLSGRLFLTHLWCVVTRVRKSGVFLLLSSRLILSIFFTSFLLRLYCVCSSTVCPAFEQSLDDVLLLLRQICNLYRQFLSFRARSSVSFLSSLAALAVSLPFEKSGAEFLSFYRRAIFSSVGRYFLLSNF